MIKKKKEKIRSTSKFKNNNFFFSGISINNDNITKSEKNKKLDLLNKRKSKISHKINNKLLFVKKEEKKRHHSTPKLLSINLEEKNVKLIE